MQKRVSERRARRRWTSIWPRKAETDRLRSMLCCRASETEHVEEHGSEWRAAGDNGEGRTDSHTRTEREKE